MSSEGRKRDFTQQTLDYMYSHLDNNAEPYFGLTKLYNTAIIAAYPQVEGLEECLIDLDDHMEAILKKNEICTKELDDIIDRVEAVESEYLLKFRAHRNALISFQNALTSIIDNIEAVEPIMPKTAPYTQNITVSEAISLTMVLMTLFGPTATIDTHFVTPEQIALVRAYAAQQGLTLPFSPEQIQESEALLTDSEAIFARLQNARKTMGTEDGIGLGTYDQLIWTSEFGPDFAAEACFATCLLLVAQYYGEDVTMRDLVNSGHVRASDAYVLKEQPYVGVTTDCVGASEAEYCARIKEELRGGNPVVIKITGHFIVAVGIIDQGSNASEILVMDPAYGRNITLERALSRKDDLEFICLHPCKPGTPEEEEEG